MIKTFYFTVYCVLMLLVSVAQAQDGAAVKLGTGAKVKNTIIWGNKGEQLQGGGTPEGSYIQGVKPGSIKFLDSLRGDLRLGKGSPCINAGINESSFGENSLDLWGNKRVDGGAIDIGASEYRTYEIHFIKDAQIGIIDNIAGVQYDSTAVEPGGVYKFKPDYGSIAGITKDMIIVQKLEGGEKIDPDAEGVYVIQPVNNNITVKIILTPPIVVTVEVPEFGVLTATRQSKGQTVPDAAGKNSVTVEQNEYIRLDTVPVRGYYCQDVWVQPKEPSGAPTVSVKSKVGKDNGLQVTESITCRAKFMPRSYPVKLKINDRSMGKLTVNDKKTGNSYSLPEGNATFQATVEYASDKTFSVSIEKKTGYEIKSIKIYDANGTSNPRDITTAVEKNATMRVGGMTIDVVLEPMKYSVFWNCSNGDLVVTPGTEQVVSSGGKKIEVDYGTVISIVPEGLPGYEYVLNTLQVQPEGGSKQSLPDNAKQWTVKGNATLFAQFVKKKYKITVDIAGAVGVGNTFVSAPVLPADNMVEYGSSLTLTPSAQPGYHCSEIWLNGVKQANNVSIGLSSITADKTVKFVFAPNDYMITYANANPSYGTLRVERQKKGTSTWEEYTSSPATASYLDKIRITAIPNVHYEQKQLTLTSASGGSASIVSGTEKEVTENMTVNAAFEPEIFKVTLKKDAIGSATPGYGKVVLKNKQTGSVLATLLRSDNQTDCNVAYGTQLSVEWECDLYYGVTGLTKSVGGAGEDILVVRTFLVEAETEVEVLIEKVTTTYSIDWEIKPVGSPNTLSVLDGGSSINKGDSKPAGTSLTLTPGAESGYLLLSMKDQYGNVVSSPYSLTRDVKFTVTFVRECRIKIEQPQGATIKVFDKNGLELADGTTVPAGSVLQSVITADNNTVGCRKLTIAGVDQWNAVIAPTTAPPSTSGNISYTIPENHPGGDIVFKGDAGAYYTVKYAAATFGTLTFTAGGDVLKASTPYWYPHGTPFEIKAIETTEGYQFNAAHQVSNVAVPSQISLDEKEGVSPVTYAATGSVENNYDISTVFEKKKYKVELWVLSEKPLAQVGSISLTGGDVELNDQNETFVLHQNTLTLRATPNPGYVVRISVGDEVKQTGTTTITYNTTPITANVTLSVQFVSLYQVSYGSDILKVCRDDGSVVLNGEWAHRDEKLKVYSAVPSATGQECKELWVKYTAPPAVEYKHWNSTLSNGTIAGEFDMPAADITLSARFDWVNYDLETRFSLQPGSASIQVFKVVGGIDQELTAGEGVLSYGDQLKVVVKLSPVVSGATDTWYEIKRMSALMNESNVALTSSSAGLTYSYVFGGTVSADVTVLAEITRKVRNVIVRVTPANSNFKVKLQVADQAPVEYDSYQSIPVPVGTMVEAWVQTSSLPEGYELLSFPGTGEKQEYIKKEVPLSSDLSLAAIFALKKYPLNIRCIPENGGRISARILEQHFYSGNKYQIDYGSNLTSIEAVPESQYYRFVNITGYMGHVDQFVGQTSPYQIGKVTDPVGIEARFEKIYKVVKNATSHGTLEVYEKGTVNDAEGKCYPAGTEFTIRVTPEDISYKCSSVRILFPGTATLSASIGINAEGVGSYTIPAALVATDLNFMATFEKKKYKVSLKRTPQEGGSAEVWKGKKPTGSLLLSLNKDVPDTEVFENSVEYGTELYFYTTPDTPDYEEALKVTGTSTPYLGGAVKVISDTAFTVKFGKLYQVKIDDYGNIHVYREGTGVEVAPGSLVPDGTPLKVKAKKTGHVYTSLSVFNDLNNSEIYSWNDPDADGVIEKSFVMPAHDVKIAGVNEPKKYLVTIAQPEPAGYTSLTATTVPASGGGVVVADGDRVEYLTSLRVVLTPHAWYEAGEISAMVGGLSRGIKEADGTFKIDGIDADVEITATVTRKQKKLFINLKSESGANGNQVVVQTEDGTEHVFATAGNLTVDVGASLKIWTLPGVGCKTTLLNPVPGIPVTTEPMELLVENMPDEDLTVTAHFALKKYPVYFTSNAGGVITVNKIVNGIGVPVENPGDEVNHFTELNIAATPLNDSYRLKKGSLVTTMDGSVIADPFRIASVTGVVDIQAEFEKIYEVRVVVPSADSGTLLVTCEGANAVGNRYPAAAELAVIAMPEVGYEVSSVEMNGISLSGMPKEGGQMFVAIPADVTTDYIEFKVNYTLKKYRVRFIATGQGVMTVDGLPGGIRRIENTSVTNDNVAHFTQLKLSVTPETESYLVSKFIIHLPDGNQQVVTAADTTIVVTDNTNVEVVFEKYYWVVYNTPKHGSLFVRENGTSVTSGARYPGRTTFDVTTLAGEGYDLESLTANDLDVLNNTVLLPAEDAVYDTMQIEAKFKVQTRVLTVVQPEGGHISVEYADTDGEWTSLDVMNPVTLDYWTQIRINVTLDDPDYTKVKDLAVNGISHKEGDVWVIRNDCRVEAVIAPNLFKVTYQQPKHGTLQVKTSDGEIVPSETEVPYKTKLVVNAIPDDAEAYRVVSVTINYTEIENGSSWTVMSDVTAAAVISINRWEIMTTVEGNGDISLLKEEANSVIASLDSVDHNQVLKISPQPDEGWLLYSLDVYGADVKSDNTITVKQDVQVVAVFRVREPFLFPVVFTPNGDGYNDSWKISGLWQAPDNKLEIYNRLQQRVYKVSPYMNEWEGTTDNGSVLPAGTYIYKFTTASGEEYTGFISLIRN